MISNNIIAIIISAIGFITFGYIVKCANVNETYEQWQDRQI